MDLTSCYKFLSKNINVYLKMILKKLSMFLCSEFLFREIEKSKKVNIKLTYNY